jgi:hypothetical protein
MTSGDADFLCMRNKYWAEIPQMALRTRAFFRARKGRYVAKWLVLSVVSNYMVTFKLPGLGSVHEIINLLLWPAFV